MRAFYRKVSQMFCAPERARLAWGVQFVMASFRHSGEAKDHIKLFVTKKMLLSANVHAMNFY